MESNESKTIKHFTDLRVWQKSHDLFVLVYRAVEEMPSTTNAAVIVEQILRSTSSISINIAEGFNSRWRRKYIKHLDQAQCSISQTEDLLHKLIDCSCLDQKTVTPWFETCIEIGRMLGSLIRKLDERMITKPQMAST